MKKFITVLISLFLLTNICFSQSGWFWQNPLPNDNFMQSVQFLDSVNGYAAGLTNSIIKTTNGGLNWIPIPPPWNTDAQQIQFINMNTGYLRAGGTVYKTTDGGNEWVMQLSTNIGALYIIDEVIGYAMSPGANGFTFYWTTNGGLNWNSQAINSGLHSTHSMFFLNQSTGYAVDNYYGVIVKTTNSGQGWMEYPLGSYQYLNRIFFPSLNTGICVGEKIFKTTNSGSSWFQLTIPASVDLYSVYFNDDYTGYCCGEQGYLFKTTDGGINWMIQNSAANHLYSINFVNHLTGWAVGISGTFLKTTNGGTNWYSLKYSVISRTLNSVSFPSQNTGYIVGDSGSIVKTVNGGSLWSVIPSFTNIKLNDVVFPNTGTGYIVGDNGLILKCTNSGINWIQQISGTNLNISSISIPYFDTIYCSGTGGLILKSINSGVNWFQLSSGTANNLSSTYFLNNHTGYVSGYGILLKTTNGGVNFSQQSFGNLNVKMVVFPNQNIGFLLIDSSGYPSSISKIKKSTNGGNTWNTSAISSTINSLFFINDQIGYFSHYYGTIEKTTDGGASWFLLNQITYNGANSMYFLTDMTGYAVGNRGTILKTTNGGGNPVSINQISLDFPIIFSLSQNYPNPFNPVTRIKYDVPPSKGARGMMVQFIIYDVLGREIETLVNQSQKPGSYEVQWDGSKYASGVYFYKLMTEEFVETRKMVLIK